MLHSHIGDSLICMFIGAFLIGLPLTYYTSNGTLGAASGMGLGLIFYLMGLSIYKIATFILNMLIKRLKK